MSDPWWPEGYAHPAFEVQRQIYGVALGGDYVRGSTVTTLPQTALRYPSQVKGFADVQGKAYLTIRPFDYITAEIAWGWPISLSETWEEVSLVRSGFGVPTTVNDGQTVFRALKADFDGTDDAGNAVTNPPPVVMDQPLQSGQWYYYTLFFRMGLLDWVTGMTGSVLIPRNFHHSEHLWNGIPPFYQYVDEDPRGRLGGGMSTLRRFLTVFGFELDQTREFVESWQDVYHADKCPFPLLKRVGDNFGQPYRSGIGDVRYRAFIAGLPEMYKQRGTADTLKFVVEAASKWLCDITTGGNLMLLPDDSDFYHGTGNWATLHPDTDAIITDISTLTPTNVRLISSADDPTILPPTGAGRGAMRVQTALSVEGSPFCITCGDGVLVGREVIPLYAGVPVEETATYGFSIQVKCQTSAARLIMPSILWFGADGQPEDYLSRTDDTTATSVADTWVGLTVQGSAPVGAIYAVPALQIPGLTGSTDPTWSLWVDLAGATVYSLGAKGSVAVLAPDSLLTLGEIAEKIGDKDAPGAPPGFTEYTMGEPR